MQEVHFPYTDCSLARHTDMLLIRELAQRLCHLNVDDYGISAHDFFSRDAAQGILYRYNVKVGDQTILAPFGLFQPKLFGRSAIKTHTQPDKDVDAEDMILGIESTGGEFQLMRTPSNLAIKADPFAGTSLSGGGGLGGAYSGGAYSNGGFIGAASSDEAAAAAVAAHAVEAAKMEAVANEAAAAAAVKATAAASASLHLASAAAASAGGAVASTGAAAATGSAAAPLPGTAAEKAAEGAAPAVITTTSYMPSASGVIAAEVKTVFVLPAPSNGSGAAGTGITSKGGRAALHAVTAATVKDVAEKAAAEAKAAAQTQFLPGARMPAGMRESVSFVAVPTEQLRAKHAQLPLKGVDNLVAYSISKCSNDKAKREMYKSILLVGGCALLPGLDRMLEKRLKTLVPQQQADINVLTKLRKMDPRNVPWRGATVIARLTSSQEMWVLKGDYEDFGVRRVRERAPFVW